MRGGAKARYPHMADSIGNDSAHQAALKHAGNLA